MFAVFDRTALRLFHQPRQFGFALDQRQNGQIAPIDMEKIEDVINEALALACLQRRLQRGKARNAVFFLDDDLAVNQRRARRKLGDGGGDVRKFFVPIEALAGEQADFAVVEPSLDAVTVELDLMRPAGAARRRRAQNGERRRYEIRQSRAARTPLLVLGAFLAAFLRRGRTTRTTRTLLRTLAPARTPRSRVAFGRAGLDVIFDAFVRMPDPFATLACRDFGDRAAADHRQRFALENVRITRAARFLVLRFDQKPWLLFFPGPAVHAHEMPSPMQLLALQGEGEMTFLVAHVRVALRVPAAAIPNHDGAAAILPLRDGSLEGVVFDRMIFHMDGKALLVRNEARAAGDRPALHHPVELEPQIIMQTPRGVFLDDELISLGSMRAPPWLRGHVELAFLAIYLKAHRSTRTPAFR